MPPKRTMTVEEQMHVMTGTLVKIDPKAELAAQILGIIAAVAVATTAPPITKEDLKTTTDAFAETLKNLIDTTKTGSVMVEKANASARTDT